LIFTKKLVTLLIFINNNLLMLITLLVLLMRLLQARPLLEVRILLLMLMSKMPVLLHLLQGSKGRIRLLHSGSDPKCSGIELNTGRMFDM